jgi:hypothetical protein
MSQSMKIHLVEAEFYAERHTQRNQQLLFAIWRMRLDSIYYRSNIFRRTAIIRDGMSVGTSYYTVVHCHRVLQNIG